MKPLGLSKLWYNLSCIINHTAEVEEETAYLTVPSRAIPSVSKLLNRVTTNLESRWRLNPNSKLGKWIIEWIAKWLFDCKPNVCIHIFIYGFIYKYIFRYEGSHLNIYHSFKSNNFPCWPEASLRLSLAQVRLLSGEKLTQSDSSLSGPIKQQIIFIRRGHLPGVFVGYSSPWLDRQTSSLIAAPGVQWAIRRTQRESPRLGKLDEGR